MKNNILLFVCLLAGVMLAVCTETAFAQQQDSTAADSLLLEQIKQQMEEDQDKEDEESAQVSPQTRTARTGLADLNPAISAIADFRSLYTTQGDRNIDAFVQGFELSFFAAIDPYARAEFYPVFEGEGGELNPAVEEAFIETLSLPLNLQLKAGKFRQSFGRINLVHRHALPVIDVPAAYENFFGEALIDQGFSLSWLIPNPAFYQELIFEYTQGPGESPLFARSDGNQLMKLAHFKNFWSLSDNATLELGFSGAIGENELSETSRIGGIDLTYKWKPRRRGTYKSFEWQTEFYFSEFETGPDQDVDSWGMYSWMQYQVAQRWFLTGMYSYSNLPQNSDFEEQAIYANVGWYATEFQKLEFGPKLFTEGGFDEAEFAFRFRWVFVIGAHGAHEY